jgi:hypothetical protein
MQTRTERTTVLLGNCRCGGPLHINFNDPIQTVREYLVCEECLKTAYDDHPMRVPHPTD